MPDREKVIKALECCSFLTANTCKECPYGNVYGSAECAQMAKDALALLKEQEAVEARKKNDGKPQPWTSWWYVCGNCERPIDWCDKFCRSCGRAVKWE